MEGYENIDLTAYRLPATLPFGFLKVTSARKLGLGQLAFWRKSAFNIDVKFRRDWHSNASQVGIQICRMPEGAEGFERAFDSFRSKRKKWVRLPEGIKFEPTMLELPQLRTSWQHEAFPCSAREIVHVYRKDRRAFFVQYLQYVTKPESMLDHPLFCQINENLRVVEGAWHDEPPRCTLRRDRAGGAKERPLEPSVSREITDAVLRAYQYLELPAHGTLPDAVQQAIYQAVDRVIASPKRLASRRVEDLAIDLGCLWGQTVCVAKGWTWCALNTVSGKKSYVVGDPKRSHVVAPMDFLLRMLRKRGENAENTTLALYNMIMAGELEKGAPKSYRVVS